MSKWTVDGFAGTSELGVPIVVLSHPSGSQERCKATSVERVLRSLNREDEFDAIKAERDAALERVRVLQAVVKDMQSGFRYVRKRMEYGASDPWYGFGIDRLEKAAAHALDGGAA